MSRGRSAVAGAALLLLAACSGPDTATEQGGVASRPESTAERFWPVYRAASAARRDGNRVVALRLYREALQIDPSHGDALYFVGQLHYERGELAAADAAIGRLAESEPRGLRAWQQLSVLAGRPIPGWLPDLERALAELDPAMALNPAESRNHYLEGRWRAYRGEIEAARASLAEAAGYNPQFHDGVLLESWLAEISGQTEVAARRRMELVDSLCAGDPGGCAGAAVARAVRRRLGRAGDPVALRRSAITTAGALERLTADLPAAELDLDGDGRADLLAAGPASGPTMLLTADTALAAVPGAPVPGWEPQGGSSAHLNGRATPWTAVGWRGRAGRRIVVAGGGERPLRLYGADGREQSVPGLGAWGAGLTLPVLAAGDLDGDGIDELLLGNVPDPEGGGEGRLVAIVLRDTAQGLEMVRVLDGPISAALIADLDGDGDADLAVGRYPGSEGIREQRLVAAVGEDGQSGLRPDESPTASAWLTAGGRSGEGMPIGEEDVPVRAFAVLGEGVLFLAGGQLEPERPAVESIWRADAAGRKPTDLAGASGSVCLRAFALPGSEVLCQRGGLVPAEPAHLELIRGGS